MIKVHVVERSERYSGVLDATAVTSSEVFVVCGGCPVRGGVLHTYRY